MRDFWSKSKTLLLFVLTAVLQPWEPVLAQTSFEQIKIFGYFQNSFSQQKNDGSATSNTFNTDQFNLFFQTQLSSNWIALVNFEMINSFSTSNKWGAFNLEEAWVRYRNSEKFNLKLGLQIPVFNHLNEIKNKTPLLPYITRPFVYEASLSELIEIEDFVPQQAFVQIYGFLPLGRLKFDYALHTGNSPNIGSGAFGQRATGEAFIPSHRENHKKQSGVDTTATFSYGGRIGARFGEIKVGFSMTYDRTNKYKSFAGLTNGDLNLLPRYRFGGDFLFDWRDLSFQSEYIAVRLSSDDTALDFNKYFYYGTLGHHCSEKFYYFLSYWNAEEHLKPLGEVEYTAAGLGVAYSFRDRITFKVQFAKVNFRSDDFVFNSPNFHIASVAISSYF